MPALLSEGQAGQRGYPPDITGRGVPQKLLQLNTVRTQTGQVNGLRTHQHIEMLMYLAMDEEWLHKHPFKKFVCKPKYKKRPFLSKEDLQHIISIKLSYKRLQAIRDMFVFMCFNDLAHTDLKELAYRNVPSDSDGNTWLVGNRVTIKVPYIVKLLPIAVEPIKKYRGVNEFKISPDRMFPENKVCSNGKNQTKIWQK